MKKSISGLMQKMAQSDDKTLQGGFFAIRGGELATNQTCNNPGTCSGTNQLSCTNSGNCSASTNQAGPSCVNSGTCFSM